MKKYRLDIIFILMIFTLALALRMVIAQPTFNGDLSFPAGDDDDYYQIAISLIESGRLAINGYDTAYRMPGFPLFVAFWHLLFGTKQPYAILPVLLVLGALLPVGTYLLARTLGGFPLSGLVAGLIPTLDPDFITFSRLYMTEMLFSLLVLASMLAVSRLRVTVAWRWSVVSGLLLGAATLTRANFGPFSAIILLWLIWHGRHQIRVVLPQVILVGMIVGTLWGGWVVRNYLVLHSFIPFTTQGGSAYYGIYNDEATSDALGFRFGYWLNRAPDLPSLPGQVWNEVSVDRYQTALAREWITAHPGTALRVALMQVAHFWSPPLIDISYLLTVVIGLPALLVLVFYQRQPELVLWLLLAVTMSALTIISVGVARYQMPLRPLLAVTTVLGLSALYQRLARFRRRTGFSPMN